ncbi:unnamed protein product [Camellia sinensis]
MCMNRRQNVSPPWLQTTVACEREDEEEIKHLSLSSRPYRVAKPRYGSDLQSPNKESSQKAIITAYIYIYFIVFKKPQRKG